MSRETVYALRRLTQKLAYDSTSTVGGNPNNLMPSGLSSDIAPGDYQPNENKMRTSADEPRGIDALGRKYEPNPENIPPTSTRGIDQKKLAPPGVGEYMYGPGEVYLEQKPAPDPQTWNQYLGGLMGNVDWSTIGGAGLGGLGAYALARMLQSKEDEEKQRFPWLSTLAGTAAGGLLLPALLNSQYAQQAGTAVGNAATGAYNTAANAIKGVTG